MSHWRKDHTRFYNILKLLMTLFRHGTGCLLVEPAKNLVKIRLYLLPHLS